MEASLIRNVREECTEPMAIATRAHVTQVEIASSRIIAAQLVAALALSTSTLEAHVLAESNA